jgi:hypothetical protein
MLECFALEPVRPPRELKRNVTEARALITIAPVLESGSANANRFDIGFREMNTLLLEVRHNCAARFL